MGNPLLDLSSAVDEAFLEKYGLKANDAILAEEKHKPMYEDMEKTYNKIEYIPGGATQNSIKVVQWLLKVPNATTFMGCVGNHDHFGEILEEKAHAIGVNTRYQYDNKEPTGTCGVLITGDSRSLCANLAAANNFNESHLDNHENWAFIEKAKFYYIAGFFLTVSPPSLLRVAKHACEQNKLLAFNLSAPFLCQFFKEPMMEAIPYVDLLFCNETEAATFAEQQDFGTTDLKEIGLKMCDLPKKNTQRKRMVVITHGAEPTLIFSDGKLTEYPINVMDKNKIVDTNGAGDAFVGGFLSQLVQSKSIEECVRCGNYAATTIIQRSGCTFPEQPDYA